MGAKWQLIIDIVVVKLVPVLFHQAQDRSELFRFDADEFKDEKEAVSAL